MRAVEITSFGAPEVLVLGTRPDPVMPLAGSGELLIRVTASGVNRPDVLQRTGNYPVPAGASDIPGLEVAGTIVGGDEKAITDAGFKIGDRVCALLSGGGYAELVVAPIGQCLPVPEGLSDVEAASLPETFFTVYSNVMDRGRLQAGETFLIQGGTSGIGVTAIQVAKAFGATVIATAGSDDKCQACLNLGADHAINYKTTDFVAEIKRLTGNPSQVTDGVASSSTPSGSSFMSNAPVIGVDVILDMVAGEYVKREIECMNEDGRLVIIAVQGGVKAEVNAGLVLRRRLTITGSTLRPRSVAFKSDIAASLKARVWPLLANKTIKPVLFKTFPALDAAKAHTLMESNQHIGKIVLTW